MGILSAIQKIVVDRYNKDSTLMLCSDQYVNSIHILNMELDSDTPECKSKVSN